MTIIKEFTLGDSTAQFAEYVSLLFYLAKKGETTAQERMRKTDQLIEAYFECRGERPSSAQLDRLASLVLRDELTDKNEHKMKQNEFPIMSDRQQERRHLGEVSDKWAESISQDGQDYQPKTRDYMRKLRLISV